jgi:hypothetical protein
VMPTYKTEGTTGWVPYEKSEVACVKMCLLLSWAVVR